MPRPILGDGRLHHRGNLFKPLPASGVEFQCLDAIPELGPFQLVAEQDDLQIERSGCLPQFVGAFPCDCRSGKRDAAGRRRPAIDRSN
jgi:hypothetical protein